MNILGYTAAPLQEAAEQFAKLPGIGLKSAARLAYHWLALPEAECELFLAHLKNARAAARECDVCHNLTDADLCPICAADNRDKTAICVVESPREVTAIERGGSFRGGYHVLHGLLSPLDGITPDMLRIKELLSRLTGDIREIIIAVSPTIEGEATAAYLARLLKVHDVAVSRLAYGLPVGANLETADDVTLTRAIVNRVRM